MEIKELEHIIKTNAQAYYLGQDCISDEEFDNYVNQLREVDPHNEILSKTGWGFSLSNNTSVKKPHKYGFSIGISDKIKPNEFQKFILNRKINYTDFYMSTKLDGASLFCYYINGKLDVVLTRGDGESGLDVTHYIKHLIPNVLSQDTNFTGYVRGEFILPNHVWEEKYSSMGKSSRNFSAGKLNALDTSLDIIKDHNVVCYYAYNVNGSLNTYQKQLVFLERNKFNVVSNIKILNDRSFKCQNEEDASKYLEFLNHGLYQCDGIVFTYGENKFAVKWNTYKVETTVVDIQWQSSRLGKLTPVIVVEPVDISGATIRKLSGYNYEMIHNSKIGKGSKILITRSGDVIPKLEEVITEGESLIPEFCPYCNTKLIVDGVNLVCPNTTCEGRRNLNTLYFIQTVAPIDGLGDKILSLFLPYFNIVSIEDLLKFISVNKNFEILRFCNITSGLGQSAYIKIVQMIDKLNDEIPLDKFLVGLGLPQLNEKTIQKILYLYSFDDLMDNLNNNKIQGIAGVNYLAIESLYLYKDYIFYVYNLLRKKPVYTLKKKSENSIIYSNERVCVTGTLSVSRKSFLDECARVGIQESSISKATILVTNSNKETTKFVEAKNRGIKIMSEDDFRQKFLRNE